MKRAAVLDLTQDDDDGGVVVDTKKKKKKLASPPLPDRRYESIDALAHAVGLSVFMLGVLADMYDEKSGKFTAQPRLIEVHFPNPDVYAFSDTTLEALRGGGVKKTTTTVTPKHLSNDEVIKSVLMKRERTLKKETVVLCGASDQHERVPVREIDQQMVWEFCGWAKTEWGYYVFAYYTDADGNSDVASGDVKQWRPVHRSHLACFHRRIRNVAEYVHHTQNDQHAMGGERRHACYDPRFIVHKWKKSNKEAERHMATVAAHIDLIRRDDFLVSLAKRNPSSTVVASSFDVAKDRVAQTQRGYVITGVPRFCSVSMRTFPDLGRSPLAKELRFTIDDLVYVARRLESADEWDPAVLMRALVIGLNHESHITRATSEICDRHGLILERDNAVPILEHLLTHDEARRELKAAAEEYILALLACDLASRQVPDAMYEKFVAPSERNLVLFGGDDDEEVV